MNKREGRKYSRRIRMIDTSFQVKFITKFSLLVVASSLLVVGVLYFLTKNSTTVAIANSRVAVRTTTDFILPVLIQTVAVTGLLAAIATIILTLFISHKISGPLYRIRKVMQELEKGDYSIDFKIRQFDQLQQLAASFNVMIAQTRNKLSSLKKNFSSLKGKLDSISEQEVPEKKRGYLGELKKLSKEFEELMSYFKT